MYVASYFEGSSCDRFYSPLSGGLQVRMLPRIMLHKCALQQFDPQKKPRIKARETLNRHNSTLKNVSHAGYECVLAFLASFK